VVQGPQTAITVGPNGESIHTDKLGRVKVHFHWNRYSKKDDTSSCWIRVSQNWGGKGWGGMFIPHVGQEVIVQFLEGDPDMPLITGRVYNAENMPPVPLPGGKTQSIIRDHGGNQIIMEGDGGSQQIAFYSPTSNTSIVSAHSDPRTDQRRCTPDERTALAGQPGHRELRQRRNSRQDGKAEAPAKRRIGAARRNSGKDGTPGLNGKARHQVKTARRNTRTTRSARVSWRWRRPWGGAGEHAP
jgi:uncharacterized protein involved in type VI secretion and phage assembly